MGGRGSGRRENPETLIKRQYEQKAPIASTEKEGIVIPNLSGTYNKVKEKFVDVTGDTMTGDLNISNNAHLILPQTNDATAPTLSFGDGDSGFYEFSDDRIAISTGGILRFYVGNAGIWSAATNGAQLDYTAPSATVPGFTFNGDTDTGIGRAAADMLSLIAGGIEGARIEEGNSGTTGTHIFVPNLTTAPSSNPTGGGYIYCEAGALKYRGSSGTTTTIANA